MTAAATTGHDCDLTMTSITAIATTTTITPAMATTTTNAATNAATNATTITTTTAVIYDDDGRALPRSLRE